MPFLLFFLNLSSLLAVPNTTELEPLPINRETGQVYPWISTFSTIKRSRNMGASWSWDNAKSFYLFIAQGSFLHQISSVRTRLLVPLSSSSCLNSQIFCNIKPTFKWDQVSNLANIYKRSSHFLFTHIIEYTNIHTYSSLIFIYSYFII